MKKFIDFLTDPYVFVPTLLGGVVAYYAKGKEADGAGRYVWPAGGVAAGLTAGYMLRSRQETAAAALGAAQQQASVAEAAATAAAATAAAQAEPVASLPPHVTLDEEYDTEIDYDGDGDIDVDDMFGDESMSLDEYEPAEYEAPVAAPSAGYRGPEPADIADATPTEEHAYRVADELAQEMGHGSLGSGNGASDADLAGGWGGYGEGTLNGDVDFDDLATGVPGMVNLTNGRGRNGHKN